MSNSMTWFILTNSSISSRRDVVGLAEEISESSSSGSTKQRHSSVSGPIAPSSLPLFKD